MPIPEPRTTITTSPEMRKRVRYIAACLNIPAGKVIEKAVTEMQERYALPDPPALTHCGKEAAE